ncbi:MAG: right-handed parallel beta-helix repeat-containing protein [Monoglobaceae bacterium]
MISFAKPDLSPTGYTAEVTGSECVGDKYKYTLSADIPKDVIEKSIIYNLSRDSGHFVIRRCRFHENRARGILVQADDGLIEDCEFYNIQGAAVQIETGISSAWCEGRGVKNLVIRNNRMIGCDVNDWDKGVIYMSTFTMEGIPIKNSDYPNPTSTVGDSGAVFRSSYPVFRNITIENNLIEEYPRRAMILTSFNGLTLRNNTFRNNISRKYNNPDRGSILVAYGAELTEENNIFEPSKYMLMPCIEKK